MVVFAIRADGEGDSIPVTYGDWNYNALCG